ncbi:MAG: MarC family protein [Lentisphaeria bacterium]|nr:MarC family protein [Lentisphaeria bacterium]
MSFNWMALVENSLYLLALLNPASKVMFLATYQPALSVRQIRELAWKSSLAALVILVVLAGAGEIVLSKIFRVELYSLKITGGMVLFMIGWIAVREGRFINKKEENTTVSGFGVDENGGNVDFTDLSLVPLAAPLIAGPGTIAASISGTAQFGWLFMVLSLTLAIFINFVVMLFSGSINRVLVKLHLLGPLIRLTGLIISAVAVQMVIAGLKECML